MIVLSKFQTVSCVVKRVIPSYGYNTLYNINLSNNSKTMVKRLLLSVAACLVGIATYAQWTEPTLPTTASELVAGHTYNVRNTDAGWYLTGGTAWYGWGTSTVLVENQTEALNYVIDQETDPAGDMAWTFKNSATGLYTFVSGLITSDGVGEAYQGLGEMHMDMASQGHNYFDITELDASAHTYRVKIVSTDDTYGDQTGYWGWIKDDANYYSAVYAFLTPGTENYCCDWEFVDVTQYLARVELYNALELSLTESSVDNSEALSVYNNESATAEEIYAAAEALTDAVYSVRTDAVLSGATMDEPKDGTSLLENNAFSDGTTDGWDADNFWITSFYNMYTETESTYVNHEGESVYPNCDIFAESWTPDNSGPNSTVNVSLNNGSLTQTIPSMPAGLYKLSADIVSAQQYETVSSMTGMQLFASCNGEESVLDITTPTQMPLHYDLLFAIEKGTLTLGVRTDNTNGNWMAVDNFELIYYGANGETNADALYLQAVIMQCETAYPEIDAVKANADIKAVYQSALEAAKAATSDYASYQTALEEAAALVAASVEEYATVPSYIQSIQTRLEDIEKQGMEELENQLANYLDNLQNNYEECTLTSEDIAALETIVDDMIIDYIKNNCQAGDDVSVLLTNNTFDTDIFGWDVEEGGVTPSWGGMDVDEFENEYGSGPKLTEIQSGVVEVWHGAFGLSQTITNMPAGLYTLTCQGYERDDNTFDTGAYQNGEELEAELYVVVDGIKSSQKLLSIYDDPSTVELYNCTGTSRDDADNDAAWRNDAPVTVNGETVYVPYGTNGSNVYFYLGKYVNTMSIPLLEDGNVTIGVRTDATHASVMWDNFRLVYEGYDVSLFASSIEELIEEAQNMIADGSLTKESISELQAAIARGQAAEKGDDIEECKASISDLREAIATAQDNVALISELNELYTYTRYTRMPSVESTDTSLETLLDEVAGKLENDDFDTYAQVENYIYLVNSGFTAYVEHDVLDATEENPGDVTAVILTPEGTDADGNGSIFGWDVVGSAGMDYGCVEIFNQEPPVSFTQTIYGLVPGYYRLGVQGFYRNMNWNNYVDQNYVDEDGEHNVDLVAGNVATRLRCIQSDAEGYNTLTGENESGKWAIPTSMEQSSNAFNAGLYQNTLQFEVTEDDTETTIGFVKTGWLEGDWFIWDNWTLQYLGTNEPSENPTTAIEEVEGFENAIATAIYDLNGRQMSQLTKGINIVKTTMADGTVKVSKVLVK